MKKALGLIIVICLLLATYHYQPRIEKDLSDYFVKYINNVVNDNRLSPDEKVEDLLVLSLNFRNQKKSNLAYQALFQADSIAPKNPLIDGLKGLYYLESGDSENVIQSWRDGAVLFPDNPNLTYLATMDISELEYLDIHMLEKMFVDTVINTKLSNPLYHKFDNELVANTEKKLRIEGSIDRTFVISSISTFFVLLYSIFRIRKALKNRQLNKQLSSGAINQQKQRDDSSVDSVSKPVRYIIAISSILKIGQVLAALFNYFMLGTDISDFVSNYVFTPSNLISLFTENILFAGIFLVIMSVEFYRRKIMAK